MVLAESAFDIGRLAREEAPLVEFSALVSIRPRGFHCGRIEIVLE
jgi:hypothetical protein